MNKFNTFLVNIQELISTSTYRQLEIISEAMLTMTGRVTMLGMSRWSGKGGSYRTIQRFFAKDIPWGALYWALIKPKFEEGEEEDETILIAGDATTITKSGKKTAGLGKFFSSIYSRAVPGVAFQCLSLIMVEQKKSFMILIEQLIPSPKKRVDKTKRSNDTKTKGRGRPKGSSNKNRRDVKLNSELTQIQAMLRKVLKLIGDTIKPTYFVYDGAYGMNSAVQMVTQLGLELVSKLRNDAALYFEFTGEQKKRGAPRVYGNKVNYHALPDKYLKSNELDGKGVRTRTYQFNARHKKFPDSLNIVIICKENTQTGKQARIILFSTDIELEWEKMINYYHLRFQIEFNFRDAKQHWGLEDFMVTKQCSVNNAANLSMWMVNLSQMMLSSVDEQSIIDLKAQYHGIRYAKELLKILPDIGERINIQDIYQRIGGLGRIHEVKIAA
jgi:putative transposase